MVDRILNWFRGLTGPSGRERSTRSGDRSADFSERRDTGPSDPGEGVVLGDLADADTYDEPEADATRQRETPGASGASTDEFVSGGYTGDPVDQEEVEEAAEPEEDIVSPRSDLDDTSGDDDGGASDYVHGAEPLDEADNVHDAVGRRSADDDTSELDEGIVDRSGVVDRSMEGDTDYVVAGYPSEAIDDIDIRDTDDIGVYDADSIDDVGEGDDADFSDDTTNLGLADSDTMAGIDTEASDASGFTPVSSDDVGVGVSVEVDDMDLIADSDDATDPSLQGSSDVPGPDEGEIGEGVQSFASTADRDVLADMQDTAASGSDTGATSYVDDVEGLGSDPSSADDPTSVGISSAVVEEEIASSSSTTSGSTEDVGLPDSPVVGESGAASAAMPAGGSAQAGSGGQARAGAVRGDGTNACPADYPIKGNATSKIYHIPGRASYDATIPEWCFATEDDAVNAGYRAPKR